VRALRGSRLLGGAAVLAALALGACGGGSSAGPSSQASSAAGAAPSSSPTRSAAGTPASTPSSAPSSVPAYRSTRDYAAVAAPVRLRIPSIGVRTPLERLGRAGDGTVEVPKRWERAGWYTGGFKPGQPGPAVVLGHVDSKTGPAVFFKLRTLRRGALVLVDRADSTTVRFRVTRVERYSKTRFPSDLVYFPTLKPSLRLVTCGGSFDTASGHYRDNVIALATAA
jgi:sortase (surface protein transpeptidase)